MTGITLKDFHPWNTWEEGCNKHIYEKGGVDLRRSNAHCKLLEKSTQLFDGLIDQTTGLAYPNESRTYIWIKCAGVTLIHPLYMLISITSIVVKIACVILLPITLIASGIVLEDQETKHVENKTELNPENTLKINNPIEHHKYGVKEVWEDAFSQCKWEIPHYRLRFCFERIQNKLESSKKDIKEIVLIPLTILGIQFSAMYGLINPYDGRKLCTAFIRQYELHNTTLSQTGIMDLWQLSPEVIRGIFGPIGQKCQSPVIADEQTNHQWYEPFWHGTYQPLSEPLQD